MLDNIPTKGTLEENILTLLCWDEVYSAELATKITVESFSSRVFKKIAKAAFEHLQKFHMPPRGHLKDIFEQQIEGISDDSKYLLAILNRMEEIHPYLQPAYIFASLEDFITTQRTIVAIGKASDLLQAGKVKEAQDLLSSPVIRPTQSPGIWLHKPEDMLSFLGQEEVDYFSSGIPTLDEHGITPARKELFLLIGAKGIGKSWHLINLGKHGIMHHKKVLHVTCEISQEKTAQRYIQTMFGMSKREGEVIRRAVFQKDENGLCNHIDFETLSPLEVSDRNRKLISSKLNALSHRAKLLIKEFPSGTLTVSQLNSYLDYIKIAHSFEPDLLIIDYLGVMKFSAESKRFDLGASAVGLRAIASERNLATATAHQGTRESMDAKVVRSSMAGEDISVVQTADTCITISRTNLEYDLGLARIFVDHSRTDKDKFFALIAQSYGIGQFCLESAYMDTDLANEVKRLSGAMNV